MPIVSDTSPILNLAIIDQLDLLRQQFGEVLIPPTVLLELKPASEFLGTTQIRQALEAKWIVPTELNSTSVVRVLERELDRGEAEAIALASQLQLRILLDEHDGRAVAKEMGLTPIGILGVLLRAKRVGEIEQVKPLMLMLQEQAGFYIDQALFSTILHQASEK